MELKCRRCGKSTRYNFCSQECAKANNADMARGYDAQGNQTIASPESLAWNTYDSCAEWQAKRGFTGAIGDPLPELLSGCVLKLINDDPEAFQNRVRQCAYAMSMMHSESKQVPEERFSSSEHQSYLKTRDGAL